MLSGCISKGFSGKPSFTTSLFVNTTPVLNQIFGHGDFGNSSLNISKQHLRVFSNENKNLIENDEVFPEFENSLVFHNNWYSVKSSSKNHSEVLPVISI